MRHLTIPKIVIDSAHYIPGYKGKCANNHGHSYIIEELMITVSGELNEQGIAIDFGDIKGYFKKEWDHKQYVPVQHMPIWTEHYKKLGMDIKQLKPLRYTTCEDISDKIIDDLFMMFDNIVQIGFTIYEGASEGSGGEYKFKSRQEDFQE